jgi:LysR family transcriptional regulator for bpeEF and oprC
MQNMDKLKALTIFVEIADQGSMSAAARSLGVVNSVITKNLNELESWLDKKLVFRSTRNLRLTQDGMNYLTECRAILNQVERLESQAHLDETVIQGCVNITAPFYLGQFLFAPLMAGFHQAHPLININLVLSDNFEDMVDEGFDIALRASQMPDSSFVSRRLKPISLKLVASSNYLGEHGAPSSPKGLKDHQCIIEGNTGDKRRWRFRNKNGKQASVSVNGNFRVNYGGMVKALCIEGLGIAQLPDFMVAEELNTERLFELLPEYALDNLYIHLLYHQKSTTNNAVKAVIDYVYSTNKISPEPLTRPGPADIKK